VTFPPIGAPRSQAPDPRAKTVPTWCTHDLHQDLKGASDHRVSRGRNRITFSSRRRALVLCFYGQLPMYWVRKTPNDVVHMVGTEGFGLHKIPCAIDNNGRSWVRVRSVKNSDHAASICSGAGRGVGPVFFAKVRVAGSNPVVRSRRP